MLSPVTLQLQYKNLSLLLNLLCTNCYENISNIIYIKYITKNAVCKKRIFAKLETKRMKMV